MKNEMVKGQNGLRGIMSNPQVKNRFNEILGEKAPAFISSVLNLVNSDFNLQKVDPQSVFNAAVVAATLDLPVDKNLGYAWIVPYGQRAQFQIGWKGFVQLAQRSGQYQRINVTPIYEGQYVKSDPLTGDFNFDWENKKSDTITHYAAYFRLTNGFEKALIMKAEDVLAHGKRYSKTFNNGPWKTDTDKMCMKTVLKLLLSRFGLLSVEMQKGIEVDQAVKNNEDYEYPDSTIDAEYSHVEEKAPADIQPPPEVRMEIEPQEEARLIQKEIDAYDTSTIQSAAKELNMAVCPMGAEAKMLLLDKIKEIKAGK